MLTIKPLQQKDLLTPIDFAVKGMHFNRYFDSAKIARQYGWFFWFSELQRASQVIAAYDSDQLAGVLLARMAGEQPVFNIGWRWLITKPFEKIEALVAADYLNANRQMLTKYCSKHQPAGEINFLAVDPHRLGQGVGSLLLNELTRREKGKNVYLFTDSNCSYHFYDRRGFMRYGQQRIVKNGEALDCFLYAKNLVD